MGSSSSRPAKLISMKAATIEANDTGSSAGNNVVPIDNNISQTNNGRCNCKDQFVNSNEEPATTNEPQLWLGCKHLMQSPLNYSSNYQQKPNRVVISEVVGGGSGLTFTRSIRGQLWAGLNVTESESGISAGDGSGGCSSSSTSGNSNIKNGGTISLRPLNERQNLRPQVARNALLNNLMSNNYDNEIGHNEKLPPRLANTCCHCYSTSDRNISYNLDQVLPSNNPKANPIEMLAQPEDRNNEPGSIVCCSCYFCSRLTTIDTKHNGKELINETSDSIKARKLSPIYGLESTSGAQSIVLSSVELDSGSQVTAGERRQRWRRHRPTIWPKQLERQLPTNGWNEDDGKLGKQSDLQQSAANKLIEGDQLESITGTVDDEFNLKLEQVFGSDGSIKQTNKSEEILIDSESIEGTQKTHPRQKANADASTSTTETLTTSTTVTNRGKFLDWRELSLKYGRMTRQDQQQLATINLEGNGINPAGANGRLHRCSCFCYILCTLLQQLFPILNAFQAPYSFRNDLAIDLVAGLTIAVMHIPQGMAYGLLAGVEPIHGLYVSFVPVVVMSFMSKSRHVSYGTFAVISMLLMNTIDSVRFSLKKQQYPSLSVQSSSSDSIQQLVNNSDSQVSRIFSRILGQSSQLPTPGLVMTDNHQPVDSTQKLLKNLIISKGNSFREQQANENQNQDADLSNFAMDYGATNYKQQPDPIISTKDSSTNNLFSTLIDSTVQQQAFENFTMPTNIEILTCVCLICGLIHITMSLMRLGVLSLMFSDQLVSSFTTASAVHVVTSQLAGLFDLNLPPIQTELLKVVKVWWSFGKKLTSDYGNLNYMTTILSFSSIIFLMSVKEILEPKLRRRFKSLTCLPSELVLMALVTLGSWYWQLNANYNVRIIGHIPTGLPTPQVPRLEILPYVIQDSFTIAIVSFAMNLSLAQVYAKRYRYKLDSNQELFALGTANVVGSFFSCFPCASSLSRSAVQSNLNARSQLCSLFSCSLVVLIICYFAPILHDLPRSTLSCIIIVALKGILVQVKDLYENWRLSKLDALVWMITFISVIVFGVTHGLVLGHLPGTDIYVDVNAFAECREINEVKIFRFNSALCYLNRTMLKARIEASLPSVYQPQGFQAICSRFHHANYSFENENSIISKVIKYLIVDCSALAYCDCSGVATLVEIIEELAEKDIQVFLAACPLKLVDIIERMQKTSILEGNIFPTISDAIGQAKYYQNDPIDKKELICSITKETKVKNSCWDQSRSSMP